ncbi:MAG: SusC/RagA family TonB-linked outer membrane protein [Bacteroidetes bacterium]|nr:SusC/RagA family TonB-linked outer membrane protein [Bacteroidota bacterium]
MAQNLTVTGKITDSKDGSPIPGVSVLVKGTSTGTVTDVNGNFKIAAPSTGTLVITYIGYDRKEVRVSSAPMNISLSPNATQLNEVAVVSIGYGTARKKDLTGAVENIGSKNFNQGAIINPVDQLAGKVAGLVITQPGGDPNQNASVRLRGQSSLKGGLNPLIVVDGMILDDPNQFQNIPPDDIASYDVLKDASAAAIYGARGANGVIIVTTKKGQAGKAVVTYDGLVGTSSQSKYYDLLSAADLRSAVPNLGALDKGANTDWQKAITRTAYQQRHTVSISGGNNNSNYIASANYSNQQGIVLNSGKEQLGLRFFGETKAIDNRLDIKMGLENVATTRSLIDYANFSYMYNSPPTYPVTNPDGSYYAYSDFNEANPVEHIQESYFKNYEYLTLINGSLDFNITNDLKIGGTAAITRNNVQEHGYIPTFPLEGNVNQAGQATENTNSYKTNAHINYDKTFGKSTLNVLAAYEYNDYFYSNYLAKGQQYITDNLDNNLGSGNSLYNVISSDKQEFKIISYFARVAYNYDNRFYVTGTIRRDGTTKTGLNDIWGNFPSFDVAYRFKKDLFANVEWLDDIKIRAGYGVTGNIDAIGAYTSYALVGPQNPYFDAVTGSYPFSYAPVQQENENLKWEERKGRNIGLDFSLFNGRLSGNMNYFNDKTTNLLSDYAIPEPPAIFNTVLANVGSMTNKGFELALSGEIVKGSKFNWTANGQISFINTKIDNLSGTYQIGTNTYAVNATQIPVGYAQGRGLSSNPITFLKPGYSPYVFFLPHYTGVDASGNQTFDGQTIAQNPNPAGHYIDPSPKFSYGITNSFDYGNWTLSFALRGVYGQKVFDNTLLDVATVTRLPGNNVTKEALTNGIKDAPVASDLWLENASFLRLDNMALGYSFKNVSFASNLRVFLAGNNIFVITKYKGLDPEVKTENAAGGSLLFGNNLNGATNQAYIDANYGGQAYYPRVRVFTIGINATLK